MIISLVTSERRIMLNCYLNSLPCELLDLIGRYLKPTDLENYLVVLQEDFKSRLELADFTTVVSRLYANLPQSWQIQLEAAKSEPAAISNTRLTFQPDQVVLTLVNGVRHGPVRFYRNSSDCSHLVGQGHYLNGAKAGYWSLRQQQQLNYPELDYCEEGSYDNDHREGPWRIQGLNQYITDLDGREPGDEPDLMVLQYNFELAYHCDRKVGPISIIGQDMVVGEVMIDDNTRQSGVIKSLMAGTTRGQCLDDKFEGTFIYSSSWDGQDKIIFNYVGGVQVNWKLLT